MEFFECLLVKAHQYIVGLLTVVERKNYNNEKKISENNIKQITQNSDGAFSEENLIYWQ